MKVLLVHSHYLQPGGEDEVFASESSLLRRHGHEVVEHVEDNRKIGRLGKWDVAARTLWSRPAARRLRPLLLRQGLEVAHFHNTFPLISPSAYYACRKAGLAVVQTLHNYRLLCVGATLFRAGQACERCIGRRLAWPGVRYRCYHQSAPQSAVSAAMLGLHRLLGTWERQVDRYIALTEFARSKFIQGGLPGEKIVVKPNFVEPDPGTRSGEGSYALFAGRLSPEKGIAALLGAWRRLPHIPLLLAGAGPLLRRVQQLVASAELRGRIRVLGFCDRDKVLELMKGARFLVVPSQWYESFPMVIAEAFACGLPVIGTGLGATAEIVENERTGLLARPGDEENLAELADRLWSALAANRTMGQEARAEFEARYTGERNHAQLLEIYQLARSARGGRRMA